MMVIDGASRAQKLRLASRMNNRGVRLHMSGGVQEALDLYQAAVEIRMKVLREEQGEESSSQESRFDFQDMEVTYSESLKEIRALDLYLDAHDCHPVSFSHPVENDRDCTDFEESEIVLFNMALAHFELSNVEKAAQLCNMALDLMPDPLTSARTLTLLAEVRLREKNPDEAMKILSAALHIETDFFKDMKEGSCLSIELNACVATTMSLMGKLHFLHGYPDTASQLCREVLRLRKANRGDDCILVATMVFNLGLILKSQGKPTEAIEHISFFIKRVSEELAQNPRWRPQVALAYQISGAVHLEAGNNESAVNSFSRALDLRKSVHNPNDVHIAETLTSLGRAEFECGRLGLALEHFKEAYAIPMQSEHAATARCHIGHVHHVNGDLGLAFDAYQEALDLATLAGEVSFENLINLLVVIGSILVQQGKAQDAVEYYSKAQELQRQLGAQHQNADRRLLVNPEVVKEMLEGSFHPCAAAA
jgi:tetratricopeptide (TPR) repeat protein